MQYEVSVALKRNHAKNVLSLHLRQRTSALENQILRNLHQCRIYPDVESSSLFVSRSLLPTVRKLKWSFRRDHLAKIARSGCSATAENFATWLEVRGKGIVQDGERVRLALCPSVKKMAALYER